MNNFNKHHRQVLGIAKGWAISNLEGFTDEDHRNLLARCGATKIQGRYTSMTMDAKQIGTALAYYEGRGWKRETGHKGANGQKRKVTPAIGNILGLWTRLGEAGKIKTPTRPALLAWLSGQVGYEVVDLDHFTDKENQNIITALNIWLKR